MSYEIIKQRKNGHTEYWADVTKEAQTIFGDILDKAYLQVETDISIPQDDISVQSSAKRAVKGFAGRPNVLAMDDNELRLLFKNGREITVWASEYCFLAQKKD